MVGDREADVCIVGAGLTGLWTAWWLCQVMPALSVIVVDAQRVGFGASGRNLGWLSGKPVGDKRRFAAQTGGMDGAIALRRACIDAVTEIPNLMRQYGIDIDAVRSGYLQIARSIVELERIRTTLRDRDFWQLTEDDLRFVDRAEILARVNVEGALGGIFSPHCARVQPAKLATGLARLIEKLGTEILEMTPVTRIRPHVVETASGIIHAKIILRATEAYSCRLPGLRRSIIPMRSNAIATEPLTQEQWERIGWRGAEGIYGGANLPFFASQTADGRIVVAGRGFPYRFASRGDDDGLVDRSVISQLQASLRSIFPTLDLTVAHAWCGVYGTTRDWTPSVSYDGSTGLGHAGGYAGQGLAASYLAGRTLADLVAGKTTEWTRLPWTNRVSPQWEIEPVRYVGACTAYALYKAADALEKNSISSKASIFAKTAAWICQRP